MLNLKSYYFKLRSILLKLIKSINVVNVFIKIGISGIVSDLFCT